MQASRRDYPVKVTAMRVTAADPIPTWKRDPEK